MNNRSDISLRWSIEFLQKISTNNTKPNQNPKNLLLGVQRKTAIQRKVGRTQTTYLHDWKPPLSFKTSGGREFRWVSIQNLNLITVVRNYSYKKNPTLRTR